MPSCMKQQVRRYFDAAAPEYENAALVQQQIARDLTCELASVWSKAGGGFRAMACHTALEIGAGVGTLAREMLPRLQCRFYLAVDVARAMLLRQRANCIDQALVPVVADGEAIPFPPQSVDLLLSSSTMQWYQNPERSIPANLDLLKPGGRFALSLFVDGTLSELAKTSQKTGFGSVYPLASTEQILNIVNAYPGITFSASQRVDRLVQANALSLLHSLRRTGARYSANKRAAAPRRLAAFCQEYDQQYTCYGGVYASYKSLCILGRKTPRMEQTGTLPNGQQRELS